MSETSTVTQPATGENQRRIGGGAESAHSTTLKPQECDLTAAELQELQEEDVTLEAARSVAAGDPSLAGDDFFTRDGLLYRRYRPPWGHGDEAMTVEQLVLPTPCRKAVLRLAHDVPLAGHMGKTKTGRRILQRFYWPVTLRVIASHIRNARRPHLGGSSVPLSSLSPSWTHHSSGSPWTSSGPCREVDRERGSSW